MNISQEARRLRLLLEGESETRVADELLLFFYRLKDTARIIRNRSTAFSGRSFDGLSGIIYDLESRPDETLSNCDQVTFLRTLLQDLENGTIAAGSG